MEKWWPKIIDRDSALATGKSGSIAGYVFAAMYIVGLISISITNSYDFADQTIPIEEKIGVIAGVLGAFILVVIWSWRIRSGRGYISSILLLLLFVFEIGVKIMSGFVGIFWYVIYLAMFITMINAVRGTWAYRKFKNDPDIEVFD